MESENNKEIQDLLNEANDWFNQIQKNEVNELMAITHLPPAFALVLKVFYAMITNQALDKSKQFVILSGPSEAKKFDTRKLSGAFQPKSLTEIMSEFDPTKLSEETVKYLKRVKTENLEGPEPQVTEQKIETTSYLGKKLWRWCKCMFEVRRKLLIDQD